MSETFGFALLVVGGVIVTLGFLWLVIRAFGTSTLWGLGTLFVAPVGLIYLFLHFRRSLGPLIVMLLGGAVTASPIIINKVLPEHKEAVTEVKGEEKRGTLTGAIDSEVLKYLNENRDAAVLQMANRKDVTDAVILEEVKTMKNLRELDLNDTPITDASLEVLAAMPKLETLRIARTQVTAEGVEKTILSSTTLKQIDVTGLGVPSKALRAWKNADPMNRKYVTGPK